MIQALDVDGKQTARALNRRTVSYNETDIPSIARGQLSELKRDVKTALSITSDRLSKVHLQDVLAKIDAALDPK